MGDIIAKLVQLMLRDDLIQVWYVKTYRTRQNETPRGETYPWHLHPNCTQMCDISFFCMNIMLPLTYCWFSYNNVASSEPIWATTGEDGSKLLNKPGSLLYVYDVWQVTYLTLLSTWLLTWLWASVSELYIYSRQVTENFNNHIRC